MEVFIGTIQIFGFNFAPNYWATCSGQILSIQQNAALFSLLGTYYGGNGVQNFQLPNLQGRLPIGQGNGQGLSPRTIGEVAGTESTTLTLNNLPAHTHAITSQLTATTTINLASVATSPATVPTTANSFIGASGTGPGSAAIYSSAQGTSPVPQSGVTTSIGGQSTAAVTGGSQPFDLMNPFLTINFSIALQGIFPSRG